MKRRWLILLATVLVLATQPESDFPQQSSSRSFFATPAPGVSLVRVMANPKEFDGMRLRVSGYLAFGGLDRAMAIYLSITDARYGILMNSFPIAVNPANESKVGKLVGNYVIMTAVFHSANSPTTSGQFDQVSEITKWPPVDPK